MAWRTCLTRLTRLVRLACLATWIVTLVMPVPRLVLAQERIAYGQTVDGQITRENFRVIFAFEGREGDIIDAVLARTEGTLDPLLILTDDQNTLLAIDDDGASSSAVGSAEGGPDDYAAAITSLRLGRDGLYFLIATRFGQDRGLTTGRFTLSLTRVGVAGVTGRPSGTVLQYGDSVVDALGDGVHQLLYAFSALRGDVVSVRMQRISGDLDPLLILADSQGNVVVSSDDDPDSPGTLDAALYNVRIQRTDNYVIIATRFGAAEGPSSGGFSLRLEKVGTEQIGLSVEFAALLDVGVQMSGSISREAVRRYYLIEVKAGDLLTVEARRTRGNLDPILELRSRDGAQLLARHDSGRRGVNARITDYRVLIDGPLVIVVSRFNQETGITAGDYTLIASATPAP
jgi:hypothetical protein